MSHRRVKVSVNKRDTSRSQQWASTRPPEPTVGEYSSLLTKSFWLQCSRSEGLFLWPAGLQRNYSGLLDHVSWRDEEVWLLFLNSSFQWREYLLCPWWLCGEISPSSCWRKCLNIYMYIFKLALLPPKHTSLGKLKGNRCKHSLPVYGCYFRQNPRKLLPHYPEITF